MAFQIEPYRPEFAADLQRICLLTGDSGVDATHLYTHPNLLGDFFALPYAVHEPDLTFVLTDKLGACGYVLGTKDSKDFASFMNTVWLPPLREQYALKPNSKPSELWMLEMVQQGYSLPEKIEDYPAHLHIDLLPRAQGQGMGRKIMTAFLERLRELKVPGVHLGVGRKNTGAIAFYEHLGFEKLVDSDTVLMYGMRFV
jgi:ribosomal protein S18 acetylase RimI-like enzyme